MRFCRRRETAKMAMSQEEQVRLLSMVDILEPLSPEELEELARRAPDTYLDEGEILYTPQETGEKLFILKKGRVQVYEMNPEGSEITLSVVESGAVFGEMTLTGQSFRGVYVRALAPSYVCSLGLPDFEGLVMRNPQVGLRLVRVLAGRLRQSELRMADLVHKEVPARLATLILTLVESEGLVSGESYRIATRYTHEQLGTMIGAKRVAVSRAFSHLKEARAVEFKNRYIHITDMEKLREVSTAG
ncbi:cyclic nucleotide-binding domain-containing protein [Rubrobacter tropicus]|uniref:Cyclic nucleotide-binding domain-containing protein n=1 Tax=Rubrobacter tropicus TaxID=2653851 RepID=A0A6G8QBT2_9ACTN|nr:Crp/Fnr family transcriptional regulator [Rubrobacter tropicus]QIN83950.1 cyclic nucleotide-binding domain-containing protein [Rubrobacter tropicus]